VAIAPGISQAGALLQWLGRLADGLPMVL